MKEKLQHFAHWLGGAFVQVLKQHPVEVALALLGCAGCIVAYEASTETAEMLGLRLALVPLFFFLALIVNLLADRKSWRMVYWICWVPLIPLSLWGALPQYIPGMSYTVTLGVLVPLGLLMACCAAENRRFVGDAMAWLRAGVLALFFSNVTLGLFCAILFSTAYIFNIDNALAEHTAMYALILCETFFVPILLLMMVRRWLGTGMEGNKIVDVLLNYIVTPALIIYLAILYLYILKIVFVWMLPEGGVAYLVFGFTIFALLVKALREIPGKRICGWFFNRFSLFALPPAVLFWVGVMRRVGEYGLTESRVWLLICGGLMTLCLLLFLIERTGRYLYAALAAFVVFAAVAYIPGLHPQRIAIRSQAARAERTASYLNLLDTDGEIKLRFLVADDTVSRKDYRSLYETLDYIAKHDSTAFSRFGLADMSEFREALPPELYSYIVNGDDDGMSYFSVQTQGNSEISLEGYTYLYTGLSQYPDDDFTEGYSFANDTLTIRLRQFRSEFRIPCAELIETQLHRAGINGEYDQEKLDAVAGKFLTCEEGALTLLFSDIDFECQDSVTSLRRLGIDAVLLR